ncbi:oxidoreductase C-terminal domain-containing protein [Pseudonocardia parietis]|nr:oxidoreductase C-terminal domain-containing protein [Pseudonocardia parietis]
MESDRRPEDDEGQLVGCAAIDSGKALRAAKRLMIRGVRVGIDDLADPAVDLRKLGRGDGYGPGVASDPM